MGKTVLIVLMVGTLAWPAFSQEGGKEPPTGPKNFEGISQRLGHIEREVRELRQELAEVEREKRQPDLRETCRKLDEIGRDLSGVRESLRGPEGERKPPGPPGRDPRELWQAMGNPTELAKRLDMLVSLAAPTLPDDETREQFKKDVEALKKKIGSELSEEELYALVRERILERIETTTNDREKAWLQGQLDVLDKSEGEARKEMVDRFVRIQNIGALHELGREYSIEREQMVKCGLAFVGYRRRPPGDIRRPDEERRPGRRPRGTPDSPRDRDRR